MRCADVLAGASIDGNDPEILLQSLSRYHRLLASAQQGTFCRKSVARLREEGNLEADANAS